MGQLIHTNTVLQSPRFGEVALIKPPYLSDEVMIKAIENEDGLPALMLKLILLANPQAVRSNKVMDALYKRNNPFPEEWIVELKQGLEVISPLENLEADVSYYAGERKTYLDLLKQYYLADSSTNAISSLKQLLTAETDVESQYELVFTQLYEKAATTATTTTLENMENMLIDNDIERDKYNRMKQLLPIISQLNVDGLSWEEVDRSKIEDLSQNNEELPGTLAKAIRMHYDENYIYQEPIYVDENQEELKTAIINKSPKFKKQILSSIKISPNPAKEFSILSYAIAEAINGLRLVICNNLGKVVYDKMLNNANDEIMISLKDFAKGNYIASIYNNGKPNKSIKFIIE